MSYIPLTILAASLMLPAAGRPADGSIQVYLQPLPAAAARLVFTIAAVTAVDCDGVEHPLKLSLSAVQPAAAARQRLIASGRAPLGSYAGLTIRIKEAALRGGTGTATLTVPDTPAKLDVPFATAANQGAVIWLILRFDDAIEDGSAFTPAFSAIVPPRPIVGHAAFVTNSRSNTITVVDKHIGQAVAIIDACAAPAGMALDQRRRRVYVACTKDDEIQSIDVATGEIVERSPLSPGDRPQEVALTPDGATLVSVNTGSNSVTFFDALSLTRRERVSVGSAPSAIAIEPGGRRGFVLNTLSSSLSVIDLTSRSLVATLSTEAAPLRAQFNRRGERLYIIHERSPYMTVMDARQLTVVTRARLTVGASAIAVDTVRDLVCIGGENTNSIEFYDPNALMPLYSMRTRAGVAYLAFDGEDNSLYLVSPETRSVAVARTADRKVIAEIDVGDGPYAVAVMGEK